MDSATNQSNTDERYSRSWRWRRHALLSQPRGAKVGRSLAGFGRGVQTRRRAQARAGAWPAPTAPADGRCDPAARAEVLALREAAGERWAVTGDGCDLCGARAPAPCCARACCARIDRRGVRCPRAPDRCCGFGALICLRCAGSAPHQKSSAACWPRKCASPDERFLPPPAPRLAWLQCRCDGTHLCMGAASAWSGSFFLACGHHSRLRIGLPELEGLPPAASTPVRLSSSEAWLALHGPEGLVAAARGWTLNRQSCGQRVLLPGSGRFQPERQARKDRLAQPGKERQPVAGLGPVAWRHSH